MASARKVRVDDNPPPCCTARNVFRADRRGDRYVMSRLDVRDDQLRSPASHQFSGTNVWRLLRMRAAMSADRPFLIWHPFEGTGRTWTYAEFARDAAAVGAGLARRGVTAGDHVLVHLEN